MCLATQNEAIADFFVRERIIGIHLNCAFRHFRHARGAYSPLAAVGSVHTGVNRRIQQAFSVFSEFEMCFGFVYDCSYFRHVLRVKSVNYWLMLSPVKRIKLFVYDVFFVNEKGRGNSENAQIFE